MLHNLADVMESDKLTDDAIDVNGEMYSFDNMKQKAEEIKNEYIKASNNQCTVHYLRLQKIQNDLEDSIKSLKPGQRGLFWYQVLLSEVGEKQINSYKQKIKDAVESPVANSSSETYYNLKFRSFKDISGLVYLC